MSRIPVRFLVDAPPYNAGEIAGFRKDKAEKLIASLVAEPLKTREVDKPPVDRAARATTTRTTARKRKG